jgi:hypothetical protein
MSHAMRSAQFIIKNKEDGEEKRGMPAFDGGA